MSDWRLAVHSVTRRPYRVTLSMVVLVSLVPLYIFIADYARYRSPHAPEIALDRAIPLQPLWSLIYGALYLFLIVLPVLTVREEEHIRRTVRAYLSVWIAAYIVFLVYPTVAPRTSDDVPGTSFGAWGLAILYDADPPYNCFPSLHVAHSFVSALTCYRLQRRLGIFAIVAAALVGVSTLFTKQHWVVDVIGGALMALVAYLVFLRGYARAKVPELDQRLAPVLALGLGAAISVVVACCYVVYRLTGPARLF